MFRQTAGKQQVWKGISSSIQGGKVFRQIDAWKGAALRKAQRLTGGEVFRQMKGKQQL